jgi:hypothetical protein
LKKTRTTKPYQEKSRDCKRYKKKRYPDGWQDQLKTMSAIFAKKNRQINKNIFSFIVSRKQEQSILPLPRNKDEL